jgi:hypothetical protein
MSIQLTDIISLCTQRKKQQLLNVPPPRLEIISPYENTTITKLQFDMRRKAEILKYEQGNTKTNSFTKKQLWTQVVNGNAPPVSTSYSKKQSNIRTDNLVSKVLNCNNTDLPLTMPSSASDVPHDYIHGINTLYLNPTIPLYNYINPVLTRSYGVINTPLEDSVIRYSNYINATNNAITTVEFTELTANAQYTLSLLNIPVAIQIYGDISGTNVDVVLDSVVIKSITLNVKYNDTIVTPLSVYVPVLTPVNNSYIVNVKNSGSPNKKTFSGTKYIGNLNISNILLYASTGYMYTFELVYNIGHSNSYETGAGVIVLKNIDITVISNVSSSYLNQHNLFNCSISFPNVTPTLPDSFDTFKVVAI